jgi:hypothetical protein
MNEVFFLFPVVTKSAGHEMVHILVRYSSFPCSFYKKMSCNALIPFIGVSP